MSPKCIRPLSHEGAAGPKGYNFPCSTTIAQMARRRRRRISTAHVPQAQYDRIHKAATIRELISWRVLAYSELDAEEEKYKAKADPAQPAPKAKWYSFGRRGKSADKSKTAAAEEPPDFTLTDEERDALYKTLGCIPLVQRRPGACLPGPRIVGYPWVLPIFPIFPFGNWIFSFVKGTDGKVCGLRRNGENGIGEHGYLVAFYSRFPPITLRFSSFFCLL